jgi:GTP-binding nuclear protein Ran
MNRSQSFKIVLLGDGGVGKTCLMNRLMNDHFEQRYIPTVGVVVYPVKYLSNDNEITIDIYDTAGQEKLGCLRDGYYHQADGAVVMYDSQSKLSAKNIQNWINDFSNVRPNSPIVICENKSDILSSKIENQLGISISVKDSVNIDEPFISMLRQLLHDESLVFIRQK